MQICKSFLPEDTHWKEKLPQDVLGQDQVILTIGTTSANGKRGIIYEGNISVYKRYVLICISRTEWWYSSRFWGKYLVLSFDSCLKENFHLTGPLSLWWQDKSDNVAAGWTQLTSSLLMQCTSPFVVVLSQIVIAKQTDDSSTQIPRQGGGSFHAFPAMGWRVSSPVLGQQRFVNPRLPPLLRNCQRGQTRRFGPRVCVDGSRALEQHGQCHASIKTRLLIKLNIECA